MHTAALKERRSPGSGGVCVWVAILVCPRELTAAAADHADEKHEQTFCGGQREVHPASGETEEEEQKVPFGGWRVTLQPSLHEFYPNHK